jgi:AcrR family transcriptional regulator
MARSYKLGRRGEQQAETRRRIVEAAVELHSTVGPARTTVSDIAERAGVQRHTVYAHFPDEQSLFAACSGLTSRRDPLPDSTPWLAIADKREQLATALVAIYSWYRRNAELAANVFRDMETHETTRRTAEQVFGRAFAAYHEVLGTGLDRRDRALLALALDFFTWRTLTTQGSLSNKAAAEAMAEAIRAGS